MMFFGSDEQLAGETVGKKITEAGGKHPLCVIHGSRADRTRNPLRRRQGQAPGTENIQVNGTDMPSVVSTIQAKLQQDPSIDWVVTLGAPFAMGALDSVKEQTARPNWPTFDLNADAAKRSRTAKSSSRSTSSRTCRATSPSTRCGCT